MENTVYLKRGKKLRNTKVQNDGVDSDGVRFTVNFKI